MNAKTRTELEELVNRLFDILEDVRLYGEKEQEKFDNMPEGLQLSERGTAMEVAASYLDDAADCIEEAIGYINSVVEG